MRGDHRDTRRSKRDQERLGSGGNPTEFMEYKERSAPDKTRQKKSSGHKGQLGKNWMKQACRGSPGGYQKIKRKTRMRPGKPREIRKEQKRTGKIREDQGRLQDREYQRRLGKSRGRLEKSRTD